MEAGGLSGGLQVRAGVGLRGVFSTCAKLSGSVVSTGQRDGTGANLWEDGIFLDLFHKSEVRLERGRDVREVQAWNETPASGIIHRGRTSESRPPPEEFSARMMLLLKKSFSEITANHYLRMTFLLYRHTKLIYISLYIYKI